MYLHTTQRDQVSHFLDTDIIGVYMVEIDLLRRCIDVIGNIVQRGGARVMDIFPVEWRDEILPSSVNMRWVSSSLTCSMSSTSLIS